MTNKLVRANGKVISNIKEGSFIYKEQTNSDVDLRPGCVSSASIECMAFGGQEESPISEETITYYQVSEDGNEKKIGVFYAEPIVYTKDSFTFTAYDAAAKLDADFSTRLNELQNSFPMTIGNLVLEATNVAGVELASTDFPLNTQQVQAFYAGGITCRQIVSWAAELACCFVRCNTEGALEFAWYTAQTDYRITPTDGEANGETYVYYKQDGLHYENYETAPLDRVAVHPVGENEVAYIYPNGSKDVNTLNITNNLLLTGAEASFFNLAAKQIYEGITSIGPYRPAQISLFPFYNPFRSGDMVKVTDIQNVSFITPIMSMTVQNNSALLGSTGNKIYDDSITDINKFLVNLSSDIVRIDQLKIDKADIDEAVVNALSAKEITLSGSLHSEDYQHNEGSIYADSGMGIDFGERRINTPFFGLSPNGQVYMSGGQIAGFTFGKVTGIRMQHYPSRMFDLEGNEINGFTKFSTTVGSVGAVLSSDGTLEYQFTATAITNEDAKVMLSQLWCQVSQGSEADEDEERVTPAARVYYYSDSDGNWKEVKFNGLRYMPTDSALGNTFAINLTHLQGPVRLQLDLKAGDTCRVMSFYGLVPAIYYGTNKLMGAADGIYIGRDGISAGEEIALTPDGHTHTGDLTVERNAVIKDGDLTIGGRSVSRAMYGREPITVGSSPYTLNREDSGKLLVIRNVNALAQSFDILIPDSAKKIFTGAPADSAEIWLFLYGTGTVTISTESSTDYLFFPGSGRASQVVLNKRFQIAKLKKIYANAWLIETGDISASDLNKIQDEVDRNAADIAANAADFAALAIGGTNLLRNSSGNLGDASFWSNAEYSAEGWSGCAALVVERTSYSSGGRRLGSNSSATDRVKASCQPGDWITASGWYYYDDSVTLGGSSEKNAIFARFQNVNGTSSNRDFTAAEIKADTAANVWTHFSVAFQWPENVSSFKTFQILCAIGGTGRIKLSGVKVELGNKATDWSPAPEDGEALLSERQKNTDVAAQNLLVHPYYSMAGHDNQYTGNGITWTSNSDGSISATGTATAAAYYHVAANYSKAIPAGRFKLPAGTYTLSGCPSGGSTKTYRLQMTFYWEDGSSSGLSVQADYGSGVTFTIQEELWIRIDCCIFSGYTANNLVFRPQIEYGSTAHAWQSPVSSLPSRMTSVESNLIYASGDELASETTIPLSGIARATAKQLVFGVPTPKSLKNISAVTVTRLIGWIGGVNGLIKDSGDSTNWLSDEELTVTAMITTEHSVKVRLTASKAFPNATNTSPVCFYGNFTLSFT